MKRIISALLILTFSITTFTACSKVKSSRVESDSDETTIEETEDTSLPTEEIIVPDYEDDQIVFIVEDWNYAWGYQYRLTIFTANGNKYFKDYSNAGRTDYTVEDAFTGRLGRYEHAFTADEMHDLLVLFESIDNHELLPENVMNDYGMQTLYAVTYNEDGSHELVQVGSYGDTIWVPVDENAYELCNRMGINWD